MTYTRTKNEAIMHKVVDILQRTHGFVVPEDQEETYEPRVAFVEGGASGSFMVLTLTDRCDLHVGDANGEWGSNLSIQHGMFNEVLSATAPLEAQLNALPYLPDTSDKELIDGSFLAEHMAGILCRMHRNIQALLDGLSDDERQELRDGDTTLEIILMTPHLSSVFCAQHTGAMDEPTSGRKSNSPEEVSDDQDRDDPDQFGRLTESELDEDPDLDPMEVV